MSINYFFFREIKLDDIPGLLRAVWLDYSFYKIHAETQQLRNGLLETLQFNRLVRDSPVAVRSLLRAGSFQTLSAAKMQDMLDIQYSPQGSNRYAQETSVIFNIYNFFQECEGSLQILKLI